MRGVHPTWKAESPVTDLTIRKLDPAVNERLRLRAAEHGCSMEEEARRILCDAVAPAAPANAFDAIRRHVAPLGGVELDLPPRLPPREPPIFE